MNINNNINPSTNSDKLLTKYLPSKKTIAIAATATVVGLLGYQMLNNYLYPDLSTLVPQACYPQSFLGFNTPFENCVPISKLEEYLPLAKTTSSIAEKVLNSSDTTAELTETFSKALSNAASNATSLVSAVIDSSSSVAQTLADKANETTGSLTESLSKALVPAASNALTLVSSVIDSSSSVAQTLADKANETTGSLTESLSKALVPAASNALTLVSSVIDSGSCIVQSIADKANETASQFLNQSTAFIAEAFKSSQTGESSNSLASWVYAGGIAAVILGTAYYAASSCSSKKSNTPVEVNPEPKVPVDKPKNAKPNSSKRVLFFKPSKTSPQSEEFPEATSPKGFETQNPFTLPRTSSNNQAREKHRTKKHTTSKRPNFHFSQPEEAHSTTTQAAPIPLKPTSAPVLVPSKPVTQPSSGTGYIDHRSFLDVLNGKRNTVLQGRVQSYAQAASKNSVSNPNSEPAPKRPLPLLDNLPKFSDIASGRSSQPPGICFNSYKPIPAQRIRTLLSTNRRSQVPVGNDAFIPVGNPVSFLPLVNSSAPQFSLNTENRFDLLEIEDSHSSQDSNLTANPSRSNPEIRNRKQNNPLSRMRPTMPSARNSTSAGQHFSYSNENGPSIHYSSPGEFLTKYSSQMQQGNKKSDDRFFSDSRRMREALSIDPSANESIGSN